MDDLVDISGIDMNNHSNLSVYIQLITFRSGSAEEISIDVPQDCQVETARCLSRRLNFRFRYSYDARKAIITRDVSRHSLELPSLINLAIDTQDLFYGDFNNIEDTDTDVDADIPVFRGFVTTLLENSGGLGAPVHDVGLSHELFEGLPLDLDNNAFDEFTNGFQCEQNGGDMLPDWSDLVNIADQHEDPDTNMLDSTQFDENAFDDLLGSLETDHLIMSSQATTGISNPVIDIPACRDKPLVPVAVSHVPTPRPLSRAESVHSLPSEHSQSQAIDILVKPGSNRSESSLNNTPSSYQEGVFSSTPGLSSLPTTYGSSPRRMGPLDSVTRAKANAVKAIGACWRCKFLRKPCNAQTCCNQCEGKRGGAWHSIGCKRGDIKNRMLPVTLCPRKSIGLSHSSAISNLQMPWNYANHCRQEILERREKDLLPGIMSAPIPTTVDKFLRDFQTAESPLISLPRTPLPIMERFNETAPAVLKPLDDCILTILWGLLECESTQRAIQPWMRLHNGTMGDFIMMLNSAAVYQAGIDSNQLIAYSLSCLRTCIEALHINASEGFKGSHEACELSTCKVDCIRDIDLQLEQYLDELSRVIFLKENMRSRIWWLSTFYSFCVQGVIRQALKLLFPDGQGGSSKPGILNSTQYLHLAVRLFTVSSGNYDPLIQDWSSEFAFSSLKDGAPSIEDFRNAQAVIKQPDWTSMGVKKSGNYLKKLFEDSGDALAEPDEESLNLTILPEPYLPATFTLETCRQLRADWDLARCNYTKNIVQIIKNHGHESKFYLDAEEKWALVEAEWKKFSDETITKAVTGAHNGSEPSKSSPKRFDDKVSSVGTNLLCGSGESMNAVCTDSSASTSKQLRFDSLFSSITHSPLIFSLPLPRTSSPPLLETSHLTPEPRLPLSSSQQHESPNQDLYHPRWIRNHPFLMAPRNSIPIPQEGYCGYCIPGRWFSLDGAYQDDKDFRHGISAVSGGRVEGPSLVGWVEVQKEEGEGDGENGVGEVETNGKGGRVETKNAEWGLCGKCEEWIPLWERGETGEVGWFVHAFGCY